MQFTFKTCQMVADTSMTPQFHEFFECNFKRVFAICPKSVAATKAVMTAAAASSPLDLLVPSTTKFGGDMDHRCSPKVAAKI